MERVVLMKARCEKTKKEFALRYDFAADNRWVLTYGVLPNEMEQMNQGGIGSQEINISQTRTGPQYRCPYCGSLSYARCGRCRKLTCYSGGMFHCAHCNQSGEVKGVIRSLEGKSGISQ